MQAAINVFWCSFFVNPRGCLRHLLTPLFDYLIENSAFISDLEATEKESYKSEFVQTHDDICDQCSISDAGIAFVSMYDKMKYIAFL